MATTITPNSVALADVRMRGAQSAGAAVQAILSDPETKAVMAEALGPYLRQYGHSAVVSSAVGLIVALGAHFGLNVPTDIAQGTFVLIVVGGNYAWQAFSIWRGKKNAPTLPVLIPAPRMANDGDPTRDMMESLPVAGSASSTGVNFHN